MLPFPAADVVVEPDETATAATFFGIWVTPTCSVVAPALVLAPFVVKGADTGA